MFVRILVLPGVIFALVFSLPLYSFRTYTNFAQVQPPVEQSSEKNNAWVEHSLNRMRSVKSGMTRADLLKVFTEDGGLSTSLWRTYVYRECPYFKVDVEFTPVGRTARDVNGRVTLVESDSDIIKSISRPYVDWPVVD